MIVSVPRINLFNVVGIKDKNMKVFTIHVENEHNDFANI